MSFIKNFPQTTFTLPSGDEVVIVNIFKSFVISDETKANNEILNKTHGVYTNKVENLNYELYGDKPFDNKIHKEFLAHEKIENLSGLEVECIFQWEVGSLLVFDRSHLHASSSQIKGKKIGLTTFTKK